MKLKVVVGYGGSRALHIASRLYALLPTRLFYKWIASRRSGGLIAGQKFRPEIDERLTASDVFLMVWTSESLTSSEAKRELEKAEELGKYIMPFIERGAVLPSQLEGRHNIEFERGRASSHFNEVIENLKALEPIMEQLWRVRQRRAQI